MAKEIGGINLARDDFNDLGFDDLTDLGMGGFDGVDVLDGDEKVANADNTVQVHRSPHRMGRRDFARKVSSEHNLEEALDWYFEEGDCYHCFSWGDVDALTYFKHVLRQQRIKYAAICTWIIAGEDILDLENWQEKGYLGRVDFYLGEIFRSSYPDVYEELQAFIKREGGRMTIFRNHAKVMALQGEKFNVLIESSSNVNTNIRCENTVVTIDHDLVNSYLELLGGITPYNHDDVGAPPYDQF